MLKKLLLVVVVLALISGSMSCGGGKSDVSGTYLCTQGSKDYDKGNILELKKDGTLYVYTPGESGVSGKWKLDGDEIYLIFEFFGMTWKGNIKGDTILLEEGSIWVKEKQKAATPTSPTPSPEKVTTPTSPTAAITLPPGATSVGDFTAALISVERGKSVTTLHFAITKASDTGSETATTTVILTDDHDNKYEGTLNIRPKGGPDDFLTLLPQDFTYVVGVTITMPEAAPIVRIKLREAEEVVFKDVRLVDPSFKQDFGYLAITKDESVKVGGWLSFTMGQAIPQLPSWKLPIKIENTEYNPTPAEVRLWVQNRDGTISWCESRPVDVNAQSKTSVEVSLPLQEIPPQPRILILEYIDQGAQEHVLKVFPMPPSKLLPFPVVSDKIYEKWKEKGFTLGLPVENEQSASVSGAQGSSTSGRFQSFERGRIYVITSGIVADQVVEISGAVYSEYSRLNFETSWLGFPKGDQYQSPTGYEAANFEGGYITTSDGQMWGAFSYESGKIAFVTDRDGNREIYVTDTNGENEQNLTQNPAADYSPAWSPDGTRIAFVSNRNNEPGIYIINSDGSNVIRVCRTSSEGGRLSWLPDGSRITFNSGSRTDNFISIVDIDGKNLQHLASHTGFNGGGPTVSPEGDRIAYMLSGFGFNTLRVVDVNGKSLGEKNLIRSFRGTPYNPSWSPDGRWIAFGHPGVYLVDPNSGSVMQLSSTGRNPSWSVDGQWIVFDSSEGGDLQIVNINGKTSRNILEGGGNRWDPSLCVSLKGVSPAPTTAAKAELEVANLNRSELTELREVVEEVLVQVKIIADEDQKSLLDQAEILLGAIQPESELRDLVGEKTEEERLILDLLEGIFAVGADYFYKIPSLIAGAIAKGAEELGNQITEWQVLGQVSFARVTRTDSGIMEVVYHKEQGEVWVSFDIYDPVGRVVMYIPVEPALVSSEGGGNILLSEGVKPVLENCRIAYQFGK